MDDGCAEIWNRTDKEERRERLNRVYVFWNKAPKNKIFIEVFSKTSQKICFRQMIVGQYILPHTFHKAKNNIGLVGYEPIVFWRPGV